MAYQLYRNTTLGNSLQESLDELIQTQQITPQLALQVLLQFDKAINTALANRVRNRVNFKVSPHSSSVFALMSWPSSPSAVFPSRRRGDPTAQALVPFPCSDADPGAAERPRPALATQMRFYAVGILGSDRRCTGPSCPAPSRDVTVDAGLDG
uniref:Transcription initiation factor IIA gamma chain n=1 Tax=Hippocampus comes TaxID=109280 RepID=A0A3Q2XWE7_HIPCM